MKCICGGETHVINSRLAEKTGDIVPTANARWRRRCCDECDRVFTTVELRADTLRDIRKVLFLEMYEKVQKALSAQFAESVDNIS